MMSLAVEGELPAFGLLEAGLSALLLNLAEDGAVDGCAGMDDGNDSGERARVAKSRRSRKTAFTTRDVAA
jgi:hypothetical protein